MKIIIFAASILMLAACGSNQQNMVKVDSATQDNKNTVVKKEKKACQKTKSTGSNLSKRRCAKKDEQK